MRLELKTQPVNHEERHGKAYVRFYDSYMRYRSLDDAVYIVVLPLFRYPGLSRTMYEN